MRFVILSILLQATISVAGSVDMHVYDPVHAQTEHSHSQDSKPSKELLASNVDDHDTADCHHCGHCAGNHLNWVSSSLQSISTSTSELQFHTSPIVNLPVTVNELLRPPIS